MSEDFLIGFFLRKKLQNRAFFDVLNYFVEYLSYIQEDAYKIDPYSAEK